MSRSDGFLHVFDMDGTLLQSTATLEIARQLGRLEEAQDIEKRHGQGIVSIAKFWEYFLRLCEDATTVDFDAAFQNAPWMEGVAETFADIRARSETVIVISSSPAFFVKRLENWGAHETHGSAVEHGVPVSDKATLMPEAKLVIASAAIKAHGLGADDCVAYGDSGSDMGLFKTFSRSVAVNASPSLIEHAAATYVGTSIHEAYQMARQLIDAAAKKQTLQGSGSE